MGLKEEVSSHYTETVKHVFGNQAATPFFKKRRAIVTGATKENSIGQAIAHNFRVQGFESVLTPSPNGLDVTNANNCWSYFQENYNADTLVLSHGVTHLDWFEDQTPKDMEEVVTVNLLGTMYATQSFIQATLSHTYTRKHIVIIGSMAHNHVLNASAPYCASKAGVAHLVRCLGWELTPKGYYVFGVHPSNVQGTPMTEATIQGIQEYRHINREQAEEYWGAVNLMPEWLTASHIAEVVATLVHGDRGYQSGTNIELTGGQR